MYTRRTYPTDFFQLETHTHLHISTGTIHDGFCPIRNITCAKKVLEKEATALSQTNRRTDREADRQKDRQTDRLSDRQTDR